MNKIQQNIKYLLEDKTANQEAVIALSENICKVIGVSIEDIPDYYEYLMGRYKLVKTKRCFPESMEHNCGVWVDLLEINYRSGESWADNGGTTAINLPPKSEIDKFFVELKLAL